MRANTITNQLNKYFSLLSEEQKELVVKLIKSFVTQKEPVSRISIEQYNKEIDEAMEEVRNGNYTTQEDLEKESSSW